MTLCLNALHDKKKKLILAETPLNRASIISKQYAALSLRRRANWNVSLFLSSYYTQIVSILRTNQQLYPVYNYSYISSCARLFTRYYYFTHVSRSAYNTRGCESIISNNNKNRVLIFSIVYILQLLHIQKGIFFLY